MLTKEELRQYYDQKALELDELAATYEHPSLYKQFFYKARSSAVLEALEPIHPLDSILDCGGGSGYYARALARKSKFIVLTDHSFNLICQARSADVPLFAGVCCDAEALPFRADAFHKVLFTEVLEHLPDGIQALREMQRVLRPDGSVVVTTPSRWSLMNIAYGLKRRVRRYAFSEHLHDYTIGEFLHLLSRFFSIESFSMSNYLVPYPLDLLFVNTRSPRLIALLARVELTLRQMPILRFTGWTMIARCVKK